jgi:hypothetical protein
MLLPRDIPSESCVADWISVAHDSDLTPSNRGDNAVFTNLAMLEEMREVLHRIPAAGRAVLDPEGVVEDLAHDAYFHIRRVENDASTYFGRTAIHARLIFLREVAEAPVTIPHACLDGIDRAFADLLSCLAGGVVNSAPATTSWESRGTSCQPKPRWVRGHQIFAALTQGLIFSFQCMGRALRAGKIEGVQKWADLSISLLRGSAAAFAFTGDFPVEEYANTVRPSMMPPESEVGLSGLMSIDHRFLAQTIRDMRPALKSLSEHDPARHHGIASALSAVYDNHIHVCERFVGARPSILTEGRTKKSGPSLIEQFKTLRLKPFEQAARAVRLTDSKEHSQNGQMEAARIPDIDSRHAPALCAPKKVAGGCPFHE